MRHFTIQRVTILSRVDATDIVSLHTDLPGAVWGEKNVVFVFHCAQGTGPEYVKDTLRIYACDDCHVEVIKG
ncbi:MAG: hypothetical protein WC551_08760 [Patescibacteria group bacterium]